MIASAHVIVEHAAPFHVKGPCLDQLSHVQKDPVSWGTGPPLRLCPRRCMHHFTNRAWSNTKLRKNQHILGHSPRHAFVHLDNPAVQVDDISTQHDP